MEEIKLSTGKLCPKCGCNSLEECTPLSYGWAVYDKHYNCTAMCGMSFGLKRLEDGMIQIGFNCENNRKYLDNRFKFKELPNAL